MYSKIGNFIKANWSGTIKPPRNGDDEFITIPFPYTVPSIDDFFTEMYYWDTYFTNVGLILSDNVAQAKNNVDNMVYFINKYGFVPNASVVSSLDRSQPPFFSQMAREIFEITEDKAWLERDIYPAVIKEYDYWENKRSTPNGLNCYSTSTTDEGRLIECAAHLCRRFSLEMPEDKETQLEWGRNALAIFESGWDCSSRFGWNGHSIAPICLASLLYMLEKNAAYFAEILGKADDFKLWNERADKRQQKINKLLWDEQAGAFRDLNYVTGEQSSLLSVATFYPLWVKLATKEQADKIVKALSIFETEYGLACCENSDNLLNGQWDYPHGWAPQHYIAIKGLLNYGKKDDALRIAKKYAKLVASTFEETGNLWEKYNVVTGTVATKVEGHATSPTMMGWSAGVFLYCCDFLRKNGCI